MDLDYSFTETLGHVTLTFYISPRMEKAPLFELKDPSTLSCDGKPLKLYRPVHPPRIRHTHYFIELIFEKQKPKRWYSVSGPSTNIRKKLDELERAADADMRTESGDLYSVLCDIYAGGSDDVRRAMNKSMEESNGTVLSTNWADVSKKEVKPEK